MACAAGDVPALLFCRIKFYGEPKPIFGDQKPRVEIFRLPSLNCPI